MACLAASWCGCPSPPPEPRPDLPNIVLIIGDDHGYRDFGFMGSEHVRTPTLDRLAREGTVFSHGFVTASVCRPSLQTLLTGLHPIQWRLISSESLRLGRAQGPADVTARFDTLPRRLARRGYTTFLAGKLFDAGVAEAGFSAGMEPEHVGSGLYSRTDLGRPSIDPVLEFLDERAEPFFLWFAPKLPHVPHDPPEEFLQLYREAGYSSSATRYYANVSRFDALVARLLAALEERGLREQTLVIYLADNGWQQGPHEERGPGWDGLKGKGSVYETGFRTPIVLHWPGEIPAARTRAGLVTSIDVVATVLEVAGAERPEWLDGTSLRRRAAGKARGRRRAVIGWIPHRQRAPPGAARHELRAHPGQHPAFFVRTQRWRYVWRPRTEDEELYDLESDPDEVESLVDEHPQLARILRRDALAWRDDMTARAQRLFDSEE